MNGKMEMFITFRSRIS